MLIVAVLLLLSGIQSPSLSHQDAIKKALDLIVANKAPEAIAMLEPLVEKNPNAANLREILGSAHAAAAEALEGTAGADARRRRHLQAAATHFTRTIELTHVNRAANLDSLVEIYSPSGLNQPGQEEIYARRLVDEHPSLSAGYAVLARVLAESNRLDAARDVLVRARTAVAADSQEYVATQLVQQVKLLPPKAVAASQLLLSEAMRIADALIAASPDKGTLVMFKSFVLETQATRVEQDPVRRASMLEESKQLWAKGRSLNAAIGTEPAPLPPAPTVPPAAEALHRTGVEAWDTVNRDPKMPPAAARKLLANANAAFDEALKLHPDYTDALIFKALTLKLEATRYEKDPARVKALIAESDRLRARAMELMKKR